MLLSGLSDEVADDEDLVRFLPSRSLFSQNGVKQAAFLPAKDGETSVFRHGAEPASRLWQIGEDTIGQTRPIYGVAIFKAGVVKNQGLNVIPKEPPPLHANITGWNLSNTDPLLAKAKNKASALEIARYSILIKKPD